MRFFYLCFIVLFAANSQAQTTGAFTENVDFNESDYDFTRNLHYYVPQDYDAAQAYPLVVGFRGGPHSSAAQFRDQLTFLADSIGAIILCPENADHFWNNEGLTKQLFKYSVAQVSTNYNIDQDMIYLTGLSYGGRHAVIVAMDTDDGDIPKLRGVIPFAAGSEADLQPNYANIDEFAPACICIGLSDASNFINVSNNLHNDIQANEGASMLNEIAGVGHTVAFAGYADEMMECFAFIEGNYMTSALGNDPELSKEFSVFPNPASTTLNFEIPLSWKVLSIKITSLLGENLLETTYDIPRSFTTGEGQLNLSEFANQTVFLTLETIGGTVTKKVIIQK